MIGNRIVLDARTGEIMTELIPGDRILRKKSREFLDGLEDEEDFCIEVNYDNFCFSNIKELKMFSKKLNVYERSLLYGLINYVEYNRLLLIKEDGKPLLAVDMEDIIPAGKNTTLKALQGLLKHGALAKVIYLGSKYFIANPALYRKGNKVNLDALGIFGEYRVLSRGGVRLDSLIKRSKLKL